MNSKFQSFQKSPLGAFVESPLGVRNNPGGGVMVIILAQESFTYVDHVFPPPPTTGGPARQAADRLIWEDFTDEFGGSTSHNFCYVFPSDGSPPSFGKVSNDPIGEPEFINAYESFEPAAMDVTLFISEVYDPALANFKGTPDAVWIVISDSGDQDVFSYDPALIDFQQFLIDQDISSTVFSDDVFSGARWIELLQYFREFPLEADVPEPGFTAYDDRQVGPISYIFPDL